MSPPYLIVPEESADADAVETLIDAAFGPGRFAKSAERLRENNHHCEDLSVVARDSGRVIGCARMWPVKIGERDAVLLGPFAVDRTLRSQGLGQALVEAACGRARAAGHEVVILVGDAPYFSRMGFERVDVKLPGPVDARRVLALSLKDGAIEGLSGVLSAP